MILASINWNTSSSLHEAYASLEEGEMEKSGMGSVVYF